MAKEKKRNKKYNPKKNLQANQKSFTGTQYSDAMRSTDTLPLTPDQQRKLTEPVDYAIDKLYSAIGELEDHIQVLSFVHLTDHLVEEMLDSNFRGLTEHDEDYVRILLSLERDHIRDQVLPVLHAINRRSETVPYGKLYITLDEVGVLNKTYAMFKKATQTMRQGGFFKIVKRCIDDLTLHRNQTPHLDIYRYPYLLKDDLVEGGLTSAYEQIDLNRYAKLK